MAVRRNDRSRRRLGRGLESLMSTPVQIETNPQPAADQRSSPAAAVMRRSQVQQAGPPSQDPGGIKMIPTEEIHPNPNQPRKHFDEAGLRSLAASIRSAGLMQPIVVRPTVNEGFQLVVGERRWRPFAGRTFWTYLLLYPFARFIIEFFRGDPRGMVFGSVPTSQFLSGLLVPVSIIMLIWLGRRGQPGDASTRSQQKRAA